MHHAHKRTTARETALQKSAGLGTQNEAFQTRDESNWCSHETLLRLCVCEAPLSLRLNTFLGELSIVSAHCHPIHRHVRSNLSGLSAAQHTKRERHERLRGHNTLPRTGAREARGQSQPHESPLTAIGNRNQFTQID